jgi:cytochrome c553
MRGKKIIPLTCLRGLPHKRQQMPNMKSILITAAATAALLLSGTAGAADQQELYTKALAATCANCHGTNGKSIKDGVLPSLAGMKSDYLVEQMQAFKSGARPATIMHQIAKGFSDEQIKLLAGFFASQQP